MPDKTNQTKLIFIYGPPAAGKLTVAKVLSEMTGLTLFHNHMMHDMLKVLFPFDDTELTTIRSHLARKFRGEIIEEAARAGVSFITTFGQTEREYYDFFRSVRESVEKHGGKVVFVQLAPAKEALLSRVESESRKGVKLDSRVTFEKLLDEHEGFWTTFPDVEHLRIDNSDLSPEQTAQLIRAHIDTSITSMV